jgi:hypothetical protein
MTEELLAGKSKGKDKELSSILFMSSVMVVLDAYSSLNSSPWTAENFGADSEKAASCRGYVQHSVVFSMAYAITSSYIAESWWPIIGAAITNLYLIWLYNRALTRGASSGSAQWAKS